MAKLTPLASQMANKIAGAKPGSPYYGLPGTTLTPYHPPRYLGPPQPSGGAAPSGGYTPPPAPPAPPSASTSAPAPPAAAPWTPPASGMTDLAAQIAANSGGSGGAHPGGPGQHTAPPPYDAARFAGMAGMQSALNASGTYAQAGTPAAWGGVTPGEYQTPAGIPQGATIGLDPGDYTPGGLQVGTGGYSGAGNWQMNEPVVGDNLAYDALQAGQNVPMLDLSTGQYVNAGSIVPGYNPAKGYTVGAVNARPAPQVPTAGNPLGV